MPCMVQAQFPRLNSAVLGISQAGQAIHHEALTPNGQAPYSEQTNKQTNKSMEFLSKNHWWIFLLEGPKSVEIG